MNEQITINIPEIKNELENKRNILFIDVREQWERDISNIDGSTHIPLGTLSQFDLTALNTDQYDLIVVYCQHGIRSVNATNFLRAHKMNHAYSMQGGIVNWLRSNNLL